jgi:hypothetical protein
VRCARCNSENPPEYRFCGMCGTPLEKPAEAPVHGTDAVPVSERVDRVRRSEPAPARSQSVSGPSFLGLSEPARGTEDVTYLFEEEQPKRTYWRFTVLLLLVAVVAGLAWLQYSRSSKSWTPPWANQKPTTPAQASQEPAPANNPPQNPAAQQTAGGPEQGQAAAQNAAGTPPPPKQSDIGAQPNAAGGATQSAPATTPAAGNAQAQAPQTNASTGKAPSDSTPEPPRVAKNEVATDNANTATSATDNTAEDSADTADETPTAKPKAARRVSAAPVAAANPDDALVGNAEKYLYGQGVPQNCDRALVSLRSAADRQNARARSLLGTMYATGHCVPRDLPNAYRWFALASRQQSDNMWVQRNLEMIWREMTPQERQLAMQTNR